MQESLTFNLGHLVNQVAVSRGLNGIGLAIVIPAIQSLVADSTDDSNRGLAFGWLQLTGNLGSIIGGLCAVLFAPTSILGVPGWRIAFHLIAVISVIVGILVGLFANDPYFSKSNGTARNGVQNQKPFWLDVKDLIKEAKSVIRIPIFSGNCGSGCFWIICWGSLVICSYVVGTCWFLT